ncbi:hypothetical protein Tco_0058365 [Tanacetum coccineum]
MASRVKVYDANVGIRTRLHLLKTIESKLALKDARYNLFRSGVFVREVCREVHVRTDVHHDVDEGLSVVELVKKITDMQRDFQSRIILVEQYVKHHKSFSRFTENPDNQAALMNKITDMEVEFHRRITSIEQYLKIPTSSNVEKSYSCGYDNPDNHVELGDKESMYVDRDVKVVEQQNVAGKNLIDEFEQQVASKNLINDEALEEPHVAGKNFIDEEDQQAIHNQLEILSMNNVDFIQGSNDNKFLFITSSYSFDVNTIVADPKAVKTLRVPFEREVKLSKYLQSPYMIQPDSTKPNHKVRAKHNKVKKRCLPLTAPDGKVIPAWTENQHYSCKEYPTGYVLPILKKLELDN